LARRAEKMELLLIVPLMLLVVPALLAKALGLGRNL
jgi:hypothetical protein